MKDTREIKEEITRAVFFKAGYKKAKEEFLKVIEESKIKDKDVNIRRIDFEDGTCFIPTPREAYLINHILEEIKKWK